MNELTSVDTDAYRSSVAMPLLMWVSLVFQVWLPQMFAQHPLQSEDTIQHVKIIKGMYSDTLLDVIFMALSNTFFWNTPTFYGVTRNTRIDYILCPRAFLPHITSCKVWRRAGDILQIIQTNQRRDHRLVVLMIRARLAYEGAPCAQRHLWDQDKIFAAATQGINRNTFINDVEKELQRRISDNTSLLDVDVMYEWFHSSMRKKPQRNTSLDQRRKEGETMSTKLPRHTVLNAVETSAHCVIDTLKRGRNDLLAQEPLKQITGSIH